MILIWTTKYISNSKKKKYFFWLNLHQLMSYYLFRVEQSFDKFIHSLNVNKFSVFFFIFALRCIILGWWIQWSSVNSQRFRRWWWWSTAHDWKIEHDSQSFTIESYQKLVLKPKIKPFSDVCLHTYTHHSLRHLMCTLNSNNARVGDRTQRRSGKTGETEFDEPEDNTKKP